MFFYGSYLRSFVRDSKECWFAFLIYLKKNGAIWKKKSFKSPSVDERVKLIINNEHFVNKKS